MTVCDEGWICMPPADLHEQAADMQPLVSVVTPFLNAEEFLDEAIQSVRAQTMSRWELLLIDDGSTDGSSALARNYAARFPRQIHYLEHDGHLNKGKGVSRNLGIAHARGIYLTFLDADDVLLPQKLEHQTRFLEQYPEAGMVYGATEYWVSWDRKRRSSRTRDRCGTLGVATDRLYSPPALLTVWLRKPGIVPCLCAAIVRTDVARGVGAFDEQIQDLYEDQIFLAKILMAGPVYVEAGCWERYRQHAGSSSAQAAAAGRYHPMRANPARLAFLEWLERYLESRDAVAGGLARALRTAFLPYRYSTLYRLLYPLIALSARFK
jgi:glycosyltransferase involved in cell wall biosynthesis